MWRTAARSHSVATVGRAAARCSVAASLLRWYQRPGVLTHRGAVVACTTLIVHPTRRMPWALHRAVRVGPRRAGRAVCPAACPPLECRAGLDAFSRLTQGRAWVLEGGSRADRHRVSVAACRRPSRSSPCSARHTACRARTRAAPPEYLIVPRHASESRALPDLAGLFFGGFSARPNTSGR